MGETLADIVIKVVPILLIIGIGNVLRARNMLAERTVADVKKLVVTVALPSVLFLAFLDMELKIAYLGIFVLILAICVLLYFYGRVTKRLFGIREEYYPFLITGFEFGMVGITLFGTAYGIENVGYIAIVDLSHELFIWFIFVTMLLAKRDGTRSVSETTKSFVQSPVIIGILAGLALNLLGLRQTFYSFVGTRAIAETMSFLGDLLIPLILLIIGYGMKLSVAGARGAMRVVVTRLLVVVPLALLTNTFVVEHLLGLDPAFKIAIFTFLILPPPFILPVFMKDELVHDREYVNNVLSLYTVVSLAIFIVYFSLHPTL